MTDPSGLTPEQDAVRRLLADARHDGPTPPEVVARLDEALASLVSERLSEPGSVGDQRAVPRTTSSSVVDLSARRRRLVGIGLLAAAAVVVAGVAIGQGLPSMEGGDGSADSAAGGERSLAESDAGAGADAGSGAESQGAQQPKEGFLTPGLAGYPTLLSFDEDLDDQLLDLRDAESHGSTADGSARTMSGCELRGIGRGRRVVAKIDGSIGLVVFRRPDRAIQEVDLYVCGDPEPVRTLTLPAP